MLARVGVVAAVALALVAPDARGDGPGDANGGKAQVPQPTSGTQPTASTQPPPSELSDWVLRRRHTIAEFELGIIVLPNAPISAGQQGGNLPILTVGHGDATANVGMHLLYRAGTDWAIGAGALFAPRPTADTTYGGASGLQRTHSRDYLWLGGEGRYIPLHLKTIEAWVGVAIGGVVVADRFETQTTKVPPDLGNSQVTVRTEGLSVGVQAGGEWAIAERLVVGLTLRYDNWILPSNAGCTPIGDCATLTGTVTELELGLRLGYRIPL